MPLLFKRFKTKILLCGIFLLTHYIKKSCPLNIAHNSMLIRCPHTPQWMEFSTARHILNNSSRNLAISARTFRQVTCYHLLFSAYFSQNPSKCKFICTCNFLLAWLTCYAFFHDCNCGTARSSEKQNEMVRSLSSLNTYVASLSIYLEIVITIIIIIKTLVFFQMFLCDFLTCQ